MSVRVLLRRQLAVSSKLNCEVRQVAGVQTTVSVIIAAAGSKNTVVCQGANDFVAKPEAPLICYLAPWQTMCSLLISGTLAHCSSNISKVN